MGKDCCFRLSRRLWGGMKNKFPKKACVGGYIQGECEGLSLLFSSFPSPVALPSVTSAIQIVKTGDESVVTFI